MTCKSSCNPDKERRHRISNIKLVSDTDGSLWELVLNNQNNSACLIPIRLTDPDNKLVSLPGRRFRFD